MSIKILSNHLNDLDEISPFETVHLNRNRLDEISERLGMCIKHMHLTVPKNSLVSDEAVFEMAEKMITNIINDNQGHNPPRTGKEKRII